jgi:UDP-N-acetylmuramyl pentapeptide synthase
VSRRERRQRDWAAHAKSRSDGLLHALIAKRQRGIRRAILLLQFLRTRAGRRKLLYDACARISGLVWRLAIAYRRTLVRHVRLVAVVGSFGKTTTTRATAVALGQRDPGHAGRNTASAVAVRLLGIRPWMRHAVIEVGIDRKGQMERLARRLRPDIAIVTSIGSEHLSSLGTLETTRSEKAKMVAAVPSSGLVVLNGDDPNAMWMKEVARAPVLTYGFNEGNDVRATDVEDDGFAGIRFRAHLGRGVYDTSTRFLGRRTIYSCLAALATAYAEGLNIKRAVAALEKLDPTYNRLQPIRLPNGAWLVSDAFKGALETIEAALDTVSRLPARRRVVVIGDVEEPPGSQGPIYKALGKRLAEVADSVVFIGGKTNFGRLKAGMIPDGLPREAIRNLRNLPHAIADFLAGKLRPDDLILLKGRSTQHLERVALILSGKEVTCSAQTCFWRHDCATCPLLARAH